MVKIFEYKAGSLVDKVGKQVGQAFDIINKRSEIGQAIETKGEETSYINFPTFDRTDLRSWSCWIKFNEINLITAVAFILAGSKMAFGTSVSGGYILCSSSGDTPRKSNYSFKPHIWYQLVCNYDETGVPSLYINTIESIYSDTGAFSATDDSLYIGKRNTGNAKSVQIAKLCFYTHELNTNERLKDYQEFLQSQPTEKPIRGFELVKPTDLSYQKDRGLLAAYNMKPSGTTLIDISGNSRNGTLNGSVINTKDGLVFNGVKSYVNCGNAIGYGSEMTILSVISPNYTSRINIIGKDNGVITKRGFYADILDTGRLRFVFSQTGSVIQYYDGVTPLGNNQKNTLAITFKGGVNSKMYINGALDKTEATAVTSIFNNSLDFNIGFNEGLSNYFNGEIQDIRVYNRELTEQEIKDYHNSFVKPIILEDWSNYAVGDTRPKEWIVDSGAFAIAETTTYKYLSCTSNGSIKINYPLNHTSVYASINYYDGSNWTTYTGLLSSLETTHSWLSVSGGYMTITLTTTTRVGKIKVYDGVKA